MFSYVAAMATAITVFIGSGPTIEGREAAPERRTPPARVAPVELARIKSDSGTNSTVLDVGGMYEMSIAEQRTLHKALFRSVRFIDNLA